MSAESAAGISQRGENCDGRETEKERERGGRREGDNTARTAGARCVREHNEFAGRADSRQGASPFSCRKLFVL